jgi:2-hydroxychromene-2-carboxylate isomerase
MTLNVELYWSFRSPYSYLATPRVCAIAREYDIAFDVRIVLPLAVRKPEFFRDVNPLWPPYVFRDTVRLAQMLGLDYAWPDPDPIVQDFATRKVAAEQPHIYRISRLGVEAARRGRGLAFIDEASRLIWGGKVRGWNTGDHLAGAAARAGLDLAAMEAAVAADTASYDAELAANQQALEAAGHWGVPTFVFAGEPFFGQDRIDVLLWRLGQHGLARR